MKMKQRIVFIFIFVCLMQVTIIGFTKREIIDVVGSDYEEIEIKEQNNPLGNSIAYRALFYLNPDCSIYCDDDILNFCKVGEGSVFFMEDIFYNESDVKKVLSEVPKSNQKNGKENKIVWTSCFCKNGDYVVVGHNSQERNKIINVNNVEDIKKRNLFCGMVVRTKGYYCDNDKGEALYYITEGSPQFLDIELENGLIAHRIISDNRINIASAGAFPNEDITCILNTVIQSYCSQIERIDFNEGTYYFSDTIYLESLEYYGKINTEFEVVENFNKKSNQIFATRSGDSYYNIGLYNISFKFPTGKKGNLYGKESILVALHNIDSCTIDNCKFYAYKSSNDGAYSPVDLLWFRFSKSHKDIVITNCEFKNETGIGENGDDVLHGGCLWFTGILNNNMQNNIKNVLISDSYFETSVSDEILAFWSGSFSDIEVTNCNFKNNCKIGHNVISFYDGSFENVFFDDNDFDILLRTVYYFKFVNISEHFSVKIDNCNWNIFCTETDPWKNTIALLICSNINDIQEKEGIAIDNCTVNGDGSSIYRTFLQVVKSRGVSLSIMNSTICTPLEGGIIYVNDSDNLSFDILCSKIDIQKTFFNITKSYGIKLKVLDNKIFSPVTGTINYAGDVDYQFCKNEVYKWGSIINVNKLQNVGNKSSLIIRENVYYEHPSIFWTNNEVKQEDYLIIIE